MTDLEKMTPEELLKAINSGDDFGVVYEQQILSRFAKQEKMIELMSEEIYKGGRKVPVTSVCPLKRKRTPEQIIQHFEEKADES